MNRRSLSVLFGALVISGAASYLVYRLSLGIRSPARPLPASLVVVAARDLETGTLLRDSDLTVARWAGPLPKGIASQKAAMLNRGVVSTIYQGEPVIESRLAPAGSGGGLAATIPAGMRACAVRVNEVVGVAGFVTPGMRVDVLITGIPPGASAAGGPSVRTLLQNLQVLSAGPNIEKDKEGKPVQVQVVNLLVDPHQAEILSLAGNETRIQLVLRNPMDTEFTSPPGISISDLFAAPGAPARRKPARRDLPVVAQVAPPPPDTSPRIADTERIEVLNGPARTVASFGGQEEHR